MDAFTLKLADLNRAPDSYKLERRRVNRHRITGRATALSQIPGPGGDRHCIRSLQLLDLSQAGLGGVSQDPIDLGSRITVFFPPHGPERGFDARGQVVRCIERDGGGYEIGVRLEAQAAVA